MEKNAFETYEFLPASNSEADAVQLFVVQNDGTFHLLTKPIQYMKQEQTDKEVQEEAESCAVYNISSQQYYVNVDNSTNLISVSDEFMLPPTDSNGYANSYLLQSDGITNSEEMEDVTVDELKLENLPEADITVVNQSNKHSNDCAEVTISDEQYQTLEQKGWILLESNDKIFVLNTLGLHDITTNDKLIQKLKNESNVTETVSNSIMKTEKILNINNDQFLNKIDTKLHIVHEDLAPKSKNIRNPHTIVYNNEENYEKHKNVYQQKSFDLVTNINDGLMDDTVEVTKEQNGSAYKIKTKLIFEDIPNKIILGKTANGKRLVAKVVKSRKPMTISEKIVENQKLNGTDLSNSQFIGLLKHTRSNGSTYTIEDVTAAEAIVMQLIKVPAIKQSIMGQNLIVTKIRNSKESTGKLKRKLTLVTGKVLDNDQGTFVHFPNLLQYLITESERMDQDTDASNEIYNCVESTEHKDDITIFHVHQSETVCEDNSVRVDINLTKRQLAIDSILDRRLLTTYACGACAAIFNTANELKEHQESLCLEMDNNLTIDIDSMTPNKETYTIVQSGRKKLFCCLQCDARFSKSSHCQKHVKTHFLPASPQKSENEKINEDQFETDKRRPQLHKCKMCQATFFVPSTLSKHILTKHIKLKNN